MHYMESRPSEFPKANIDVIMGKLSGHKQQIGAVCNNVETCSYSEFAANLRQAGLVEHEIATIARHFARGDGGVKCWS